MATRKKRRQRGLGATISYPVGAWNSRHCRLASQRVYDLLEQGAKKSARSLYHKMVRGGCTVSSGFGGVPRRRAKKRR